MTAGKLGSSNAVQVARQALAAYDANGEPDEHGHQWTVAEHPAYWASRVAEALRLALAAIDDAEEPPGPTVPDAAARTGRSAFGSSEQAEGDQP